LERDADPSPPSSTEV